MSLSEQLPVKTVVNRVIPKNAFDSYTNTKQKKQMVDLIERIRWTNKLSLETINLSGKEITEIQLFEIELRKKESVSDLLKVMDKAIPYHVIFQLHYADESLISTSKKHTHPGDEDTAVIDWTFSTDWFDNKDDNYALKLERNLDYIFLDFCKQLSGRNDKAKSINDLIVFETKIGELTRSITKLNTGISSCKQFNKKVELNTELNKKREQLNLLIFKNTTESTKQ
ncbi:DUF4391 domain-containing protein [Mucilaginibacter sp. 14171R-50]|uniref:DUF4391 domain-containing protein n=1 Tax=Mucilaginibacter sp. 14171R-50 TaxID=2703789 RepID=UPI00138DB6E5|nr:DUF4391 domain-containing protein [Mucilaginibacter sp. 14171R-50]QHS56811.1 DUF4391 domain-containing protein [Mucilaginibacter sp. 14171R-50]